MPFFHGMTSVPVVPFQEQAQMAASALVVDDQQAEEASQGRGESAWEDGEHGGETECASRMAAEQQVLARQPHHVLCALPPHLLPWLCEM